MYWAVATVTTTGYGDVSPGTIGEMAWAIFSMLLGLSVFSYFVTSIASALKLINATHVRATEIKEVRSPPCWRTQTGLRAFAPSRY